MANIPIWTGNSTFMAGATPFGFYDNDLIFGADADKVSKWCASRLGFPIVNVELQSGSFYTAFEEAITVYGNQIYQYKVRENYLSMEGNGTGSAYNDQVLTPSLGSTIRIAKTYGAEASSGGHVTYYTGSVPITASIQDYDLDTWAISQGITGSIEIKRVFHDSPPAILRYFDPFVGTGIGTQNMYESFGFGSMSPAINFTLMPIFFDVQQIQQIEFNDQIRRSAYSFDLVNNKLRIFPIPSYDYNMFIHYVLVDERDDVTNNNKKGQTNLITNVSKVPYQNPIYSQINSIGKQWIYQYTLAVSKEMLGYVRKKYNTIPIPGAEVTLNGDDLIASSIKEKDALLEQLKNMLEETSRKAQLERQSQESQFIKDQLTNVPLLIYIM